MVTVNYICFVIALFIRGAVSRAQETVEPPRASDYGVFGNYYDYGSGSYGAYDYGKQYGDYVKQYRDYVSQYGDYAPVYGDYGAAYNDYGTYDQNDHQFEDYGYYDDEDGDDLGEHFSFGDRNNPLDTIVQINQESPLGIGNEIPWVYIIVPVVQVDVFFVGDEQKTLEDMEIQFPIETFLFELGNFGLGHLDLGDFGLGEMGFMPDYALPADYLQYDDYPTMGHYPDVNLYNTADELNDWTTLDYPGIDHDSFWVDWIFMLPPDDIIR
uniref:Uncharacterized protein n=1 Tax=Graphocephala atropunctata TaxID=36148 RepID=A0A1B6LP34_9HEMI